MKEYVLSIISAAVICAVIKGLLGQKTATGRIAELLCGILIAVTVIAPLGKITFRGVSDFWGELSYDAEKYAQEGMAAAEKERLDIIKSQSEAYILDKADRMGLQIAVEVELDDHNENIPCGVVITGKVSPYAQTQLGDYMENTLGIPKENQEWR